MNTAREVNPPPTIAATSPSRSCVSASAATSTPAARAAAVVCGPIETAGIVDAERGERARGRRRTRARRGRPRAAARPQLARAVERHEVGAELVDEQPPRALGAGEEDAAGRSRQLREQPLLRRDARARGRRRPSAVGRRAARSPRPAAACRAAAARARGAVRARDDDPVVAGDVDRLVAERLDLDQRADDDLVPERLEPPRELVRLRPAAG